MDADEVQVHQKRYIPLKNFLKIFDKDLSRVKLFLLKKKEFIKTQNHEEETGFEIPADIQNIIHTYGRKCL